MASRLAHSSDRRPKPRAAGHIPSGTFVTSKPRASGSIPPIPL